MESGKNVLRVRAKRRFDRVGDVRERDVFGEEERDGEESGMVVSQAISSARRILDTVFVEAKEKENEEARAGRRKNVSGFGHHKPKRRG